MGIETVDKLRFLTEKLRRINENKLKCYVCGSSIKESEAIRAGDEIYCPHCYERKYMPKTS